MPNDSHYRADIDGLRGVAVLCVIIFHGFSNILPGGFIGVDIFFVISGYLICGIILRDVLNGSFSISKFYVRRIKRIFPALATVLAATCAIGWLLFFPDEFKNLGKHLASGAAFIANLTLWKETGYFVDTAEHKPLLHLWSLGIEEQFYLFFPLALWYAHRKNFATTHFLAFLLIISFGLCFYGTWTHPSATFYFPVTRLWELLVGCTLASIELRNAQDTSTSEESARRAASIWSRTGSPAVREASSCVGTIMILTAAFCLNKTRAFPGGWALLPTIGTALIIAGGSTSAVNQRIFSNKVIVGVGLISYPLYLWHWPLLSFVRIVFPDAVTNLKIAGVLLTSVALAFVTFKFIERPIRFGNGFGRQKVAWLCVSMSGLLVVGLLAKANVITSRLGMYPLGKDVSIAKNDSAFPFPDNFMLAEGFKNDVEIIDGKKGSAVLFIGDSHMTHYWPRIANTLSNLQSRARPVIIVTAGGSPALPNVNRVEPGYACDHFFDYAIQQAERTNVGTIVFCSFWEKYFIGVFPGQETDDIYRIDDKGKTPLRPGSPATAKTFAEFGQVIARLSQMGKEVIVIESSPTSRDWDPRAISSRGFRSSVTRQVRVGRAEFESFISPIKTTLSQVAISNGAKVIDPLDYFVEDDAFYGKSPDGRFRYKDAHHLRPFFVVEKATFLDALLQAKDDSVTTPASRN